LTDDAGTGPTAIPNTLRYLFPSFLEERKVGQAEYEKPGGLPTPKDVRLTQPFSVSTRLGMNREKAVGNPRSRSFPRLVLYQSTIITNRFPIESSTPHIPETVEGRYAHLERCTRQTSRKMPPDRPLPPPGYQWHQGPIVSEDTTSTGSDQVDRRRHTKYLAILDPTAISVPCDT